MPDDGSNTLNAVFTMDVLPAVAGGEVRGPRRWDDAQRAMRAFAETLRGESMTATFFIQSGR